MNGRGSDCVYTMKCYIAAEKDKAITLLQHDNSE